MDYVHAGKKYLPYAMAFPVLLFTVLGIWRIVQIRKGGARHLSNSTPGY